MAAKKRMIRGKGWHGDTKGHAKAGRKGGQATAKSHGEDFYRKIGAKGGKVSPGNFRFNPNRAREAGRKGGRARGRSARRERK
ncbi:MAG: KGG domain-containing protein [Candidatus Levybacteria bacterium]|nr:KGG domain-containing protein [Candidatus Levybacteria bacterium]